MTSKTFLLIDGNAILHRAFHALPPLTSKDGNLVNAVYGFFSMFLKILSEVKPDHAVICFDRPKPTFRKTLYVGYQAHRPKMDDTLIPQIQTVHEILGKAKYKIFEIDGYEADDLIGTISKKVVDDFNSRVIIVSGDRDMLQLVNSHVKVLAPITGITKMILFDEKLVEEKYGIKSSQIVDYKSLAGDSSDNYPGVPGVGPKTASTLLKEYGTLENLYQNIDGIKKKNENLSIKLATGIESAGLAKKLATIVTDAPITLD
ncbi:MAG: DNA polymerase I, partial [Patescibacteria group bacterium]|nr:DNA polymerase I [Patescibacteria group bacterium]